MLTAEKKIRIERFRQMEFEGEDAYYELINGEILKKPAPTPLHQAVFWKLVFLLVSIRFRKKTW